MDEFVGLQQRKSALPKNTVVITFDDGFANYEVAAPILDDFCLPATFLYILWSDWYK